MKNILFMLTFFSLTCHGQWKSDKEPFVFIENPSDIPGIRFLQSFECVSVEGDDLTSLYRAIESRAHARGANCFGFKDFRRDRTGRMSLKLDTYFAEQKLIEEQFSPSETNIIYIISDVNFDDKTYSFKVNGEKKVIRSGTYYRHVITRGDMVKINKGGLLGTTANIVWEENRPPLFFTLSGLELSDGFFVLRTTAAPVLGFLLPRGSSSPWTKILGSC